MAPSIDGNASQNMKERTENNEKKRTENNEKKDIENNEKKNSDVNWKNEWVGWYFMPFRRESIDWLRRQHWINNGHILEWRTTDLFDPGSVNLSKRGIGTKKPIEILFYYRRYSQIRSGCVHFQIFQIQNWRIKLLCLVWSSRSVGRFSLNFHQHTRPEEKFNYITFLWERQGGGGFWNC